MIVLIPVLIILTAVIILIHFIRFITTGKPLFKPALVQLLEILSLLVYPFIYLSFSDFGLKNDCCYESATFSPGHQLTMYVLIICCLIAYFYSSYRKTIATPVVELITNSLLLTGIVLNIIIGIHINEVWLALIGNVPIILLEILMLVKNQQLLIEQIQAMEIRPKNGVEKTAWTILSFKPLIKIPILFVLCLPVLVIITGILLLAGQQPDSMIRAFTDTYKHGFSQLDYMCNNVECGGHFLCSVAAKGHKQVVKPVRLGMRHENLILCNRQLLISNAFEELIQQKIPALHKPIRKSYNQIGRIIHRYYSIFDNKWICDCVYLIMKPAEWLFLLVLYTFDKKPENRIAKQYLSKIDRQQMEHAAQR